jgi:hypothetical protein
VQANEQRILREKASWPCVTWRCTAQTLKSVVDCASSYFNVTENLRPIIWPIRPASTVMNDLRNRDRCDSACVSHRTLWH